MLEKRDSLNHIQGNNLGTTWIGPHDDYSHYSLLICGMVNLERLTYRKDDDDQSHKGIISTLVKGNRCQIVG